MKKFLAIALALILALGMVACSTPAEAPAEEPAAETPAEEAPAEEAPAEEAPAEEAPAEEATDGRAAREPIAAADLKIGVILVHDENSGYDLAHIEGVQAAVAELGIDESQVIFKYNIPEDETCYDNAVDLAEQGCQIVFSDSYGHQTYMMQAAAEYPDVTFVACTGDMAAASTPNTANIFPYTFQSRYVSGVVAGMKLKELMDAGTVTDPYVGYVGAYPYDEVVSGYTAFYLGIKSIVPEAHMDVQYTNSWYDPVAEGEAANALIAKGCVIIGQHADSTGAPQVQKPCRNRAAMAYKTKKP